MKQNVKKFIIPYCHQEHQQKYKGKQSENLEDKIKLLENNVFSLANQIFIESGSVLQRQKDINKAKKLKKENNKKKEKSANEFDELAKKKKMKGPYAKGQNDIDTQMKIIKNLMDKDEDKKMDFINKEKQREKARKYMDKKYQGRSENKIKTIKEKSIKLEKLRSNYYNKLKGNIPNLVNNDSYDNISEDDNSNSNSNSEDDYINNLTKEKKSLKLNDLFDFPNLSSSKRESKTSQFYNDNNIDVNERENRQKVFTSEKNSSNLFENFSHNRNCERTLSKKELTNTSIKLDSNTNPNKKMISKRNTTSSEFFKYFKSQENSENKKEELFDLKKYFPIKANTNITIIKEEDNDENNENNSPSPKENLNSNKKEKILSYTQNNFNFSDKKNKSKFCLNSFPLISNDNINNNYNSNYRIFSEENKSASIEKLKDKFFSCNKTTKNQLINNGLIKACLTTWNFSEGIQQNIEKKLPLNKKIKKMIKNAKQNFLRPSIVSDIKTEIKNNPLKLKNCIYPSGMDKPVYLVENSNNVIRQSEYVDNLNEFDAFEQRNMIYNNYNVSVGDNEIIGYNKDVKKYYTNNDLIRDLRINDNNCKNYKLRMLLSKNSKKYNDLKESYLIKKDKGGINITNKSTSKKKDEKIY